ncbi:MAG: isoprenylcysteine carboxylmethyltransferase family protein [Deltaproteobacteria bacterium]|nr:isoprenylcysteine carboxylmethyltransferase family protein [Deltaproteobacteria bacterium]
MKRYLGLAYALMGYAGFLALFLYWLGFLINYGVPKGIDGNPRIPLATAALINLGLVSLFGLQHSIMARQWLKSAITKFIPEPLERSTYVVMSNLALGAVFLGWQPMGGEIWNIQDGTARTVLYALFAAGAVTVVVTSFLINHFDLFGLRQAWSYFRGVPYKPLRFTTPGPYKWVRHPLYVGWLTTLWVTPTMTAAHLAFALLFTAYILSAIRFEERDLQRAFGDVYRSYQQSVPMLVPRIKANPAQPTGQTA